MTVSCMISIMELYRDGALIKPGSGMTTVGLLVLTRALPEMLRRALSGTLCA